MCNVNSTGEATSGGLKEDFLTFHKNPQAQRPLLTFINLRSFHQQPVLPDPMASVTPKVDQVCDSEYACIFNTSIPPVCLFLYLNLGGTDGLFIDLQDVNGDLCERVMVEQCQAMLFVSGL